MIRKQTDVGAINRVLDTRAERFGIIHIHYHDFIFANQLYVVDAAGGEVKVGEGIEDAYENIYE